MFTFNKKRSASTPVPAIRRYRVQVSKDGSWVIVQEFSGPDLLPDEAVKYALSLFASSTCNVSVLTLESNDSWSPLIPLMRYDFCK